MDELLLDDAYKARKPVLGICYGLQILNVYRKGSLVQHIESAINHEAGRQVPIAHTVAVEPGTRLAELVGPTGIDLAKMPVNSSHHQSAEVVGEGLRMVARCSEDGVVEALEGTSPDHFVLAVQWHPERSVEEDAASRAIFRALVMAAEERRRVGARSWGRCRPLTGSRVYGGAAPALRATLMAGVVSRLDGRGRPSLPFSKLLLRFCRGLGGGFFSSNTTTFAIAALSAPMPSGVFALDLRNPTGRPGVRLRARGFLRIGDRSWGRAE